MVETNYIFFGATKFSETLLIKLISQNYFPRVIFSIPQEFSISYSNEKIDNCNYGNLKKIAEKYSIDFYEIDSLDGRRTSDYYQIIKEVAPDLILVLGWYYMVPKKIRDLTKYGAWGLHASLLPEYAGGAPLTWAILNGEEKTGVTLFRMEDGVDDGDIIRQKSFEIEYNDTIRDVYEKATEASEKILLDVFKCLEDVFFIPQNKLEIKVYPQRCPEDGLLNLNLPALELYNFIRAQSSPYPGAYIETVDGKKLIIEKARIEDL